jgi:hypothetical protein
VVAIAAELREVVPSCCSLQIKSFALLARADSLHSLSHGHHDKNFNISQDGDVDEDARVHFCAAFECQLCCLIGNIAATPGQ